MEKLGVVLDDEKTKTAGTEEKCPKCGRPLEAKEGDVRTDWWCATCGTEPWEKRPEQPQK